MKKLIALLRQWFGEPVEKAPAHHIAPVESWWSGPEKYAERTGVRHRNPLNVKAPNTDYWRHQVGRDTRGHAIFGDAEWGVRAGIVLLRTYWTKYHLRTVAEILARWAPVTDTVGSLPGAPKNSPREYAEFIERRSGLRPMQSLQLFDTRGEIRNRAQLAALVVAMAEFEIGAGFQLDRGVVADAMDLV